MMDVILSCFFENFEETERNSLHARYKRQAMVEYFNTLIEGCRLGKECEAEVIVQQAIIGMLRYHEDSRSKNGGVCLMGRYHDVLYIAVKLCYDWQLKDTQTVASLLDEIYSCENTFERILVGALFGTRAPHYIAGWKSDFDNQEENVRAMVYFLDHATNASLEYKYGPNALLRYIDIPIESCGKLTPLKISIQLGLPDKLHILLRFGAQVVTENEDEPILVWLLDKLTEYTGCYPYNFVSCLQLVSRVLPDICARYNRNVDFNLQRGIMMEKYSDLINHCILPLNRCGITPTELKHLCRCAIRRILWQNFQLPNGIRKLPIPGSLHKYLDLLED